MKANTIYKFTTEGMTEDIVLYWSGLGLVDGLNVLCLGEITNMPNHYTIVVGSISGRVIWGVHDNMFLEIEDY